MNATTTSQTYEGAGRIYAEVFDQHNRNGVATFIASLFVENNQAAISIKRIEFETLTEAQAQVDDWANRYGLAFLY